MYPNMYTKTYMYVFVSSSLLHFFMNFIEMERIMHIRRVQQLIGMLLYREAPLMFGEMSVLALLDFWFVNEIVGS